MCLDFIIFCDNRDFSYIQYVIQSYYRFSPEKTKIYFLFVFIFSGN